MVISRNTQLGLMWWSSEVIQEWLKDTKRTNEIEKNYIPEDIPEDELFDYVKSGTDLYDEIIKRLGYNTENKGSEFYTIKHPKPYYYLIQPSVEKCSELIRVKDDFSCAIFKSVRDGEHVYLLGKNEFFRFVKFNGVLRGNFWNRENHISFEIGMDLDNDKFYSPKINRLLFNRIIKMMIFIELGDIEIVEIKAGRNNGATKKSGEKIANTTDYTVYVVDSSWNKLIIRTDGFAVRGHFRLQPCGANMADRKLIWIAAFEKHGYKRQPKASILHD